jgi:hypothetical protein
MHHVGAAPRGAQPRGAPGAAAAHGLAPCPAPSAPQQPPGRRRDVGAGVFGTWGPPPVADPRRFLDMAAFAGTLVLPRQQDKAARDAERARARQQREQQQREAQREAAAQQQAAAAAAAVAAAAKKPLRLSWAGSGIYFW